MSVPISAIPNRSPMPDCTRHVADYHPTIWGDHFLRCASRLEDTDSHQAQLLKDELRQMLRASTDKPLEKLNLINSIQRLGIAYHFVTEIEQELEKFYAQKIIDYGNESMDLHTLALAFRLLRQGGYNVSSDIFKRFKDGNGNNFKQDLAKDVQGLLSLYQASFLSVHGEKILDEALVFTRTQLEALVTQSTCPAGLADQVRRALDRPLRKNINRLEAWSSIVEYEQDKDRNEALLRLAKLDFEIARKIHRGELSELTKWWTELDFARKLPFSRDRLVECYFWPLGIFFEPQFGVARKLLTKTICLLSVVDDIYDAFGTLEELEIYTRVVSSFDASKMEELPEYMQVSYRSLLDLFSEIEEELARQGKPQVTFYPKEEMRKLLKAYLLEAKWLNQGVVPTTEEYLRNALITSVYPLLVCVAFCGMGDIASQEVFDWLYTDPKPLKAASAIARIMDDIVSHKFEQGRGHVASAVECYTKQHNVTEQEASIELYKMVANAWKDINEVHLEGTAAPVLLMTIILNFAQVIDVVYKDEDSYTHSKTGLKAKIDTLLLQPLTY